MSYQGRRKSRLVVEQVGSSEWAIFTDGRDEREMEKMECEGVGGTNTRQLVEWGNKSGNRTPSDVSKPWHFASMRGECVLTRESGGGAANRHEKVEGGRYSPENVMSERAGVGGRLLREEEEGVRSDEWALFTDGRNKKK